MNGVSPKGPLAARRGRPRPWRPVDRPRPHGACDERDVHRRHGGSLRRRGRRHGRLFAVLFGGGFALGVGNVVQAVVTSSRKRGGWLAFCRRALLL